ncbi:hypothetical protein An12g07680 [Aspergillus niger]|uniref:Uncharacterized protein n=2 Tax=Aspergillus niger TaxID=5061 RepID=A2R078_ASPNC|nr:hypothetical protein An12g07680 [Aspergillus niger]CAK48507.1 hypothetical protein An12g07680 [Aspergillus niger]
MAFLETGPPGDKSCTRAADCGDSWCELCDADSSIRGRSSDKSRVSIGSMAIGARTLPFMQLLKKGLLNTGDTTADVETTLRDGDRMTDATREPDEVERDRRGSAGNPRDPIRPPRLVTCRLILDFTATRAQSRRYYDCTDICHNTGLSIKTRLKNCPFPRQMSSAMKHSDHNGGISRRHGMLDNVFSPRIDPRVRIKTGLQDDCRPRVGSNPWGHSTSLEWLWSAAECIPALCARPSRTASISTVFGILRAQVCGTCCTTFLCETPDDLRRLGLKSRAFDGLMSPGCWSLLTDFGIDLKPRAGGREIRRREANPSQVGRSDLPGHWLWGISKASTEMPGTMPLMQRNTAIGSLPASNNPTS